MSDYHRKACEMLSHYLRTAWEAAGLQWDADNDAEVADLVKAILIAADAQARGAQ